MLQIIFSCFQKLVYLHVIVVQTVFLLSGRWIRYIPSCSLYSRPTGLLSTTDDIFLISVGKNLDFEFKKSKCFSLRCALKLFSFPMISNQIRYSLLARHFVEVLARCPTRSKETQSFKISVRKKSPSTSF